jgi:hypothetical protein
MITKDENNLFFMGGKYRHYPLFLYCASKESEYPYVSLTFVRPSKYKQAEAIKEDLCESGKLDYYQDYDNSILIPSETDINLLKESVKKISLERVFGLYSGGLGMLACRYNKFPVFGVLDSPKLGSAIFSQIVDSCNTGNLSKGADLFLIGDTAMECLNIEKRLCLPVMEYKLMLK